MPLGGFSMHLNVSVVIAITIAPATLFAWQAGIRYSNYKIFRADRLNGKD
jgi:hypothetical protein